MAKKVKMAKKGKNKVKIARHRISSKLKHKEISKIAPKTPKCAKKGLITKGVVEDTILTISGDIGVKVVNYLGDKHNISEFIIADKLKIDMQTIRNTLYKLHTHNVATYIRKKDRQKGWYISYWTFNKKRIKDLLVSMKKMQIEKLKERLEKEEASKGLFYICPKTCARLDFDQATEFEFKCPECGSLLNQQENTRTIENLKGKIQELEASNGTC